MEFWLIPRAPGAFQQPVTPDAVEAICRRAFGSPAKVLSATELGTGLYNTTLKLVVAGRQRPVILRIAPEPGRQFSSERTLMRNEYASLPHLGDLAAVMPRLITADFTHEIIGRDYMIQTLLDGIPATQHLPTYPRSTWPAYYRQLGELTHRVHTVRGPAFGPVAGPTYPTWSEAVVASLTDIAADLEGVGLDASDIHQVAAAALGRRTILDQISEPRLLAGDLWVPNTLLDDHAAAPTITGICDLDRTSWGDPAADWTIRMISAKPDQRHAFWDTYGPPDQTADAAWRQNIYQARHVGAIRLERHRLNNTEGVKDSYQLMAPILAALA